MSTYIHGNKFAFDAQEMPVFATLGLEEQWVPGQFPINGHLQTVMAPLSVFDQAKIRRVKNILMLHRCPGRAA